MSVRSRGGVRQERRERRLGADWRVTLILTSVQSKPSRRDAGECVRAGLADSSTAAQRLIR